MHFRDEVNLYTVPNIYSQLKKKKKKENSGSFKGLPVKCGKQWYKPLPYNGKPTLLFSKPVCWDLGMVKPLR